MNKNRYIRDEARLMKKGVKYHIDETQHGHPSPIALKTISKKMMIRDDVL